MMRDRRGVFGLAVVVLTVTCSKNSGQPAHSGRVAGPGPQSAAQGAAPGVVVPTPTLPPK